MGIPWKFNDKDSKKKKNDKDSPLSLLRAQVQFLMGEQRSRKLLVQKVTIIIFKLKKKVNVGFQKWQHIWYFNNFPIFSYQRST